jgi:uncharacterized protein affecting Mg2+/Co2+ transport
MITRVRPLLLTAILTVFLICLLGANSRQAAREPAPSFSLTITVQHTAVKPNSAIPVKVKLVNLSDHSLPTDVNPVLAGYAVEVRDKKDKPALMTRRYWNATGRKAPKEQVVEGTDNPNVVGYGQTGKLGVVPPGKASEFTIDIRDFYDLSRPGDYTVQLSRGDPDSGTSVKSNKLTITVSHPSERKNTR